MYDILQGYCRECLRTVRDSEPALQTDTDGLCDAHARDRDAALGVDGFIEIQCDFPDCDFPHPMQLSPFTLDGKKAITYYGRCDLCKEVMSDIDERGFVAKHRPHEEDGSRCFSCWFWSRELDDWGWPEKRRCIVNGNHYRILPEAEAGTSKTVLGHAGAEFRIKFHSGDEVVSHNVWHQGEIPEYWRTYLPDNAEFVQ